MLSHTLRLAGYFYLQDVKQTHQRFMSLTQLVLMVFILTLSQTSDSIQRFLTLNLDNLLGADLVLSQQGPLTQSQLLTLTDNSAKLVETLSLNTTLVHNGVSQRVKLKAVGQGYPLHGELQSASALAGPALASVTGPGEGEIWVDSRLLARLSLQIGEQLTIADQQLTVTRVLIHEPDRLMEGHNVEMRALMWHEDFTALSFPQDLVQYRFLLSADSEQIDRLLVWQKEHAPAAQVYHKRGAHPLALFWQRTENFMGLASVILFFMAAIAIQQLTQMQVQKEQFFSAICISLGASKQTGLLISLIKWGIGFAVLMPVVLMFSSLCHWAVIHWLSASFPGLAWQWNMLLAVKTLFATALIFLVFQLPVWLALRRSSVAQLILNTKQHVSTGLSLACATAVLTAIAIAYSDNGLLTAMLLGAMAVSVLLILMVSWGALSLGERLSKGISGLIPFTLYMMRQRMMTKTTQILGVGLCAFLLLFTLMLLKDLGDSMSAYERHHNGNLLVSQASKIQMKDIESWARKHQVDIRQNKPFMYAKLTQVNGVHLADFADKPSESLSTFNRPIRLHWTDAVPDNNRLVDGHFWQPNDKTWQQISIEQEVMTDLGLALGDRLTFYIAEQSVDFTLVAGHAYQPGAGSITFWVQMPPAALTQIDAPHYNMASLELNDDQFSLLNQLWQRHPSLRMVSLQEMTARFDATLAMVTQVISGFALLIIILASIVIVTSVYASESREKKKNSIIMSFGFSRSTCLKLNLIEWSVTGSVAASGAIIGTWAAGLLIYQSQFSMTYQPDITWLLATLVAIIGSVTALGYVASKKSLTHSVRELMAE